MQRDTWCDGCAEPNHSRFHVGAYRLWISYGWIVAFMPLGAAYLIARFA